MKTDLEKKWLNNFILFGGNQYPRPLEHKKFMDTRKFEFDFCWPDLMIACEIEGGQWIKGGHTSGKGLQRDCEKNNFAVLHGWKLFRFSTSMIDESKYYNPLFHLLPKVR